MKCRAGSSNNNEKMKRVWRKPLNVIGRLPPADPINPIESLEDEYGEDVTQIIGDNWFVEIFVVFRKTLPMYTGAPCAQCTTWARP